MTQSAKHGSKDLHLPKSHCYWSLGLLESMGHDRHPIRVLGNFHYQQIFTYGQSVSSYLKMNNSKTIFLHNSCIGIYMKYLQVKNRKIKRWSIHWGMQSSIGNTWVPVKIICILDYCKTKACLTGLIPSMGLLLFHGDVIECWEDVCFCICSISVSQKCVRFSRWIVIIITPIH